MIGVFDVLENGNVISSSFDGAAMDADGIYYDQSNDVLYQLNRTENVINAYSNVRAALKAGMKPMVTATSTSDFTNGREIAVSGNKLVVTQDANDANGMQNRLIVYDISPLAITLEQSFDVDINLWGIYADVNTLYAIEDNSENVVVFNSFFTNTGNSVEPDEIINIEGMGRTHGINYITDGDIMILTDVADAGSAEDGAYTIITNFGKKGADGTIDLSEQVIVEGDLTQLGNPVDIAYDGTNQLVYVAERANEGGKLLVFRATAEGNIAPLSSTLVPGVSALFLEGSVSPDGPTTYIIPTGETSIQLNVFPNPTIDNVHIHFNGERHLFEGTDLDILSVDGKLLNRYENVQDISKVSLAEYNPGHYLFVFKNKSFEHSVKLNKI